jgi:hypothetical protein
LPEFTLWIDREDPVIWKSRVIENARKQTLSGDKEPKTQDVKLQYIERFTIASIDTNLPDELFQFKPPADAKQVEKFTEEKQPERK